MGAEGLTITAMTGAGSQSIVKPGSYATAGGMAAGDPDDDLFDDDEEEDHPMDDPMDDLMDDADEELFDEHLPKSGKSMGGPDEDMALRVGCTVSMNGGSPIAAAAIMEVAEGDEDMLYDAPQSLPTATLQTVDSGNSELYD